jgi:hypothetical protein
MNLLTNFETLAEAIQMNRDDTKATAVASVRTKKWSWCHETARCDQALAERGYRLVRKGRHF